MGYISWTTFTMKQIVRARVMLYVMLQQRIFGLPFYAKRTGMSCVVFGQPILISVSFTLCQSWCPHSTEDTGSELGETLWT